LDAAESATNLLPQSLNRSDHATVLISHPHQDHWGLIAEIPPSWPVWTGSKSASLIALAGEISRRPLTRRLKTWGSRSGPLAIGPFRVTPMLTDHSAVDAYMLLIEGAGKRILYTGDFRRHGRKSSLVNRLMATPPPGIDVLVTEGTNLGADKPVVSEKELERQFVDLFGRTKGRVFVSWSGQNIDRTVTLYRAAKRCGRTLAVDLYTADVLERMASGTRLPRPGWPNITVVVTSRLASFYRKNNRADFVARMAKVGISAKRLKGRGYVAMLRRALIDDYQCAGVMPTSDDAFNFSMWRGYKSNPYHAEALEWCRTAGAEIAFIHTSGHASVADLRAFAEAMRPQAVIPVHGLNWGREADGFGPLRPLADGETMIVE
jgi:ribonuclease J